MTATNAPRVYGYIRWSTDKQTEGDSLKRQQDLIDAYVSAHGVTLHELLIDKAHSAEDGSNITHGKLGKFIADARAGNIPPGTKLLVEHEDRITRQTVSKATRIVGELVEDFKITIVYLSPPEREVTPDNINDIGGFISTAVRHSQANTEVVLKNNRIRKSWGRRKVNASPTNPVTAMTPAWLKVIRDSKGIPIAYDVDEERAKVVKQIFEWSAGGYGVGRIAKKLLKEKGVLPFGKSLTTKKKKTADRMPKALWHPATVAKLLNNRAVLGEYQPGKRVKRNGRANQVKDKDGKPSMIYPPIIGNKLFFLAAERRKKRRTHGGGRQGAHYANLFGQMLCCAYCGEQMKYRHNTPSSIYLRCAKHMNGYECERVGWRYHDFEQSFLAFFRGINPGELLSVDTAASTRNELGKEIESLEGEVAHFEAKREETYSTMEISQSASTKDFLAKKLDELSTKIDDLKGQVATKKETLNSTIEKTRASDKSRAAIESLIKQLQSRRRDADVYKLRLRISNELKSLIGKIYVASVGMRRALAPSDPTRPPLSIDHPDAERFFVVTFPQYLAQLFVAPKSDNPLEGAWGTTIDIFGQTFDTREGPPRPLVQNLNSSMDGKAAQGIRAVE